MGQSGIDSAAKREALARTLGSSALARSKRSRELLAYLVETKLANKEDTLKAFTIAADVFGRGSEFDADNDSLVRVQAGRLREALERYYQTEGCADPIRIALPKGCYVPLFSLNRPNGKPLAASNRMRNPK